MTERVCTKCKTFKPLSKYFKGKGYKDGYRRQCKTCCSQANNVRGKIKRRRKCGKCQEVKEASRFSLSKNNACWCKECCRKSAAKWRNENPEKYAKQNRRWREDKEYRRRMIEYGRRRRLFIRYEITVEDYDSMFDQQGGICAICKEPPSKSNTRWGLLQVDHCHETGDVRGLLCGPCNMGLGSFHDKPERLAAAKAYLASSARSPTETSNTTYRST